MPTRIVFLGNAPAVTLKIEGSELYERFKKASIVGLREPEAGRELYLRRDAIAYFEAVDQEGSGPFFEWVT